MSLVGMIREQVSFPELPLWRKVVIGLCLALAVFSAAMAFNKEIDIYGSAPDHPVAATGQTYPVKVNHGSLRYVTPTQSASLQFWEDSVAGLGGTAVLVALLSFITYRDPRRRVSRLPLIVPEDSRRS